MKSLIKTGVAALALLGGSMSVSAAQIDFTDGAYSSLNGNQTSTVGGITFFFVPLLCPRVVSGWHYHWRSVTG